MPPKRAAATRVAAAAVNGTAKKMAVDDDVEQLEVPAEDDGGVEEMDEDGVQVVTVKSKSESRLLPPLPRDPEKDVPDTQLIHGDGLNLEAQTGFVKEFIESEGLAMLFSMECGLVLFHLKHTWIGGDRESLAMTKHCLQPGKQIKFLCYYLQGPEYECISPEGFMRQAAAVWTGDRPAHLLREVKSFTHQQELKEQCASFLKMVRQKAFMEVSMVRARGQVMGYLTDEIGLLEVSDEVANSLDPAYRQKRKAEKPLVLYSLNDVYLFGEQLKLDKDELFRVMPIGLNVCFDARKVPECRGVKYQAINCFAGHWPAIPHPTLLQGGSPSLAPSYQNIGSDASFYYLQLSLPDVLDKTLWEFRKLSERKEPMRNIDLCIENKEDYDDWRSVYGPKDDKRAKSTNMKDNWHQFDVGAGPRNPGVLFNMAVGYVKKEGGGTIRVEIKKDA